MRVSSHDRVRIEHVVAVEDDTSQVLKVDLVDDTGTWWNDLEIVEGLGAPLKELEALAVPLELQLLVPLPGLGCTCSIHLHRMVNDQVDRAERVDLRWVSTKALHGIAHGRQIDDSWHTTKLDKVRLGLNLE